MMQYYIEPNLKLMRDIHYWRLLARDYVVVALIRREGNHPFVG